MSITTMAIIAALPAAVGIGWLASLAVAVARDPGQPTTRAWSRVELAGLRDPAAWRPACEICQGRHCAGCAEPARTMAAPHRHIALHGEDEIPPSILVPALLMDVVSRARELTRQVGDPTWHPWRRLPRLERVRYVAATVAARHGRATTLGRLGPTAVLP